MASNTQKILAILEDTYRGSSSALHYGSVFQLLVAVILSAQTNDNQVNKITDQLFRRYPDAASFAALTPEQLEPLISSCGLYKNKAKNIKLCAKQVLENFNGVVPHTMEELISLAGVGRKSANVVMLEAFGIAEGIAVDTHAKRISNLIGLSNKKEPEKIEQDLLKTFPKEYWKDLNHLLVWHGRNTCVARSPKCDICPICDMCKYFKSKK